MDNTDLKQELILRGLILPELVLYKKFKKRLTEQPELLEELMMVTSFLEYDADIKARLHCVMNDIVVQPKCSTCGNVLKMRMDGKYRFTFSKTCGSKCFAGDNEVKRKRKETNLRKYGATNFLTSQRGIQQSKTSMLKRYGVTNAARISGNNEKRLATLEEKHGSLDAANEHAAASRKKTMLKRYGVDHAMHSPEIAKKQKQTCMDNYGVSNPWLSDVIQQRRLNTMIDRYGVEYALQHSTFLKKHEQTMKDTYGMAHALQNEQLKNKKDQTMKDTYGVAHALQDEELKDKAIKQRKQTMQELYGCHSQQRHISDDSLTKLHDAEWLTYQHQEKQRTLLDIAIELKVQHSTIGRYFSIHNINVMRFNFSRSELDLFNMISDIVPDEKIVHNTKKVIPPQELDVFMPKRKLAFEYNGIYWHSELQGKTKKYHINKTNQAGDSSIRLIHIFEHEWILKQPIVESRIRSVLGKTETKIYARKCDIVSLDSTQRIMFNNANHIQGDCPSSINYGLVVDNEVVACMTFGRSRFSKGHEFELLRFANKLNTSVVGGASRLFKHFIKTIKPNSIITYSDKRWNTGELYSILGFTYSHTSSPNYFYFHKNNNLKLLSRQSFQKHKLESKLGVFDPNMTEWENMAANGYDRIWDCGNDVYSWTVTSD